MRLKCIVFLGCILAIKFCTAQVNLQTGAASLSFPIFSFNDAKSGLSTSINLRYSSGGMKVNDVASNVGLGWSLDAAGVIIRQQNGEADDQNSKQAFPPTQTYLADEQMYSEDGQQNLVDNYYANGYQFSEFKVHFEDQDYQQDDPRYNGDDWLNVPRDMGFLPRFRAGQNKNYLNSRRTLADRQMDFFSFKTDNYAGQFVIGKNWQITPIVDTKAKIEKFEFTTDQTANGIRSTINEFHITTETGIIYKFRDYELSEVMKSVELSSDVTTDFTYTSLGFQGKNKFIISKWFLSEIVNPLTNESIQFQYEDFTLDFVAEKQINYQKTINHDDANDIRETIVMQEISNKVRSKRLKKIILPDGHTVEFSYSDITRYDVPGDLPLQEITIKDAGQYQYSYIFVEGYFYKKEIKDISFAPAQGDAKYLRLCLQSFQKKGQDGLTEPPHQFLYYTGIDDDDQKNIVPPRYCVAQDHYGFYNRSSIVDIDNESPDKQTLRSLITVPASYRNPYPGLAKNGMLKSVQYPMGGKLVFEYEQNDYSPTVQSTINIGGVRIKRTIKSEGSTSPDVIEEYTYKKSDGSQESSAWGYEGTDYLQSNSQTLRFVKSSEGGYDQPGQLAGTLICAWANNAVKNIVSLSKENANWGDYTSMSQVAVNFAVVHIITEWLRRLYVGLIDPYENYDVRFYGFYPSYMVNAIGIQYSRVEVKNTSLLSSNGKVVYQFRTPVNIATEAPSLNFPYPQRQRFWAGQYGLPKVTTWYNSSNLKVKEIENSYLVTTRALNTGIDFQSCRVQPNKFISGRVGYYTYTIDPNTLTAEYYYPITGRIELTDTKERTYKTDGQSFTEIITTYGYNADHLLNFTSRTQSNGDVTEKKIYYVNDYNSSVSLALQELKNDYNAIALPVSTETWLVKKGSGSRYLVDASIKEFSVLANFDIQVTKLYELETAYPVSSSVIQPFNPAVLNRAPDYFKEKSSFLYNEKSNLIRTIIPDGMPTQTMYDYENRFLVAQINNVDNAVVAYSSFEGTNKGEWNYDEAGIVNEVATRAPTGIKYYDLAGRTISNSSPFTQTCILSFWSTAPVNIAGVTATLKKSAPVINGWTYYEYEVTGGVAANAMTITGNVHIDELRFYPTGSTMITYTYHTTFGKTSECDANNRILYYDYDGLGRLTGVRDQYYNLVQTKEYHYKQ